MTRFGLALGSGGARGLAHLGVLEVLEEAGLAPRYIAGTSMGAIIGALFAELQDAQAVIEKTERYTADPRFRESWEAFVQEPAEQERTLFDELRRSIQRRILTLRGFTSPSMQSAQSLLEPLQQIYRVRRIEDLALPFAAVAIDLYSGQPRIFRRGDLVPAIYASSAIPAVFPPLSLDGQLLTDGGGPYRVPVQVCRDLGAEFVLAVDIPSFAAEGGEFHRGIEVLLRSDQIARNRLNQFVLREADFVVQPRVERFHWASFCSAEEIRQAGAHAMRAALSDLRRRLRRRGSPLGRLSAYARRRLARERPIG
ncbi:MAG: hypothetical protein GF330_04135 [Candidatus Eisenbacteria bacterium]|nr:hypothetical protein [Candidatus Eisenbacteria bacterium]